ncbi:MAG: hypothetical protein ACXWP4_20220, partial [Polyangiales bacterium]
MSFLRCALFVATLAVSACDASRPNPAGSTIWTSNPTVEGPCVDGTTRDCHVDLGVRDGVRTCFGGRQDCRAGVWSACEGDDVTLSSLRVHSTSLLHTKSLSDASTSACVGDPCDPSCVGFDEVPDGGLAPTVETSDGGSASGWFGYAGGSPPGFFKKLVCDGAGYDCNVAGSYNCTGQGHCTKYSACEDDFHCDPGGACLPSLAGWTWPKAVCPVGSGPDLTV